MRSNFVPRLRTLAAGACAATLFFSVSLAMAQDKPQKDQPKDGPKVSEGEAQAAQKINAAQGPDSKLKAAVEYLKKNSKGVLRPRVAENIAEEIGRVNDPGQRLTMINEYNKAFNQPAEADLIKPTMIEALSRQNKFEEVVAEGGKFLEKNPEDVIVLTLVAFSGASLVQKNPANAAVVQTATKTGTKAVELMEADKKPEKMNAEYWNNFRNSWLPRLYQAQGMVFFFTNNKPSAKESLEKSMGLDPYDANTLMMIGNIQSDEYQALATKYQTEKKSALLDQALAKMDELVDTLARTAAAMEGDARFQQLQPTVMEQLKQYYSFRHDNKTDGLKELIEKHKKKP